MVVELKNPELKVRAEEWMARTGRPFEELVEDAMTGYLEEQAEVSKMLDRRYDDILSGKVKMIPGEEVEAYFRAKALAGRSQD